jgi:hypothetical protein
MNCVFRKNYFFLLSLCFSINFSLAVRAADLNIQDAEVLYEMREQDLSNALKAAEIYKRIAAKETSPIAKAENLVKQASSLYFFALWTLDNSVKLKWHQVGEEASLAAAKIYSEQGDSEGEATSYAWAGDNLSGWVMGSLSESGAMGVFRVMFKVPILTSYMQKIEDLGQMHVNQYAHHRILGTTIFVLPWPKGDKPRGLSLLKEANEQTLSTSFGISQFGPNVIAYALMLMDRGDKVQAKDLLSKFVAISDYQKYNEDRIPDTKREQGVAKKILLKL